MRRKNPRQRERSSDSEEEEEYGYDSSGESFQGSVSRSPSPSPSPPLKKAKTTRKQAQPQKKSQKSQPTKGEQPPAQAEVSTQGKVIPAPTRDHSDPGPKEVPPGSSHSLSSSTGASSLPTVLPPPVITKKIRAPAAARVTTLPGTALPKPPRRLKPTAVSKRVPTEKHPPQKPLPPPAKHQPPHPKPELPQRSGLLSTLISAYFLEKEDQQQQQRQQEQSQQLANQRPNSWRKLVKQAIGDSAVRHATKIKRVAKKFLTQPQREAEEC